MRAPRAAARVPASSCFSCMPPGVTPSTFQLSGRSAASDIVGHEVDLVVAEPVEAARDDQLELRARDGCATRPPAAGARRASRRATAPGCRRRRCAWGPARSRSPSRPRRARRAAGAPSAMICSSVAASPTASAPITTRRSAECPVRKPAFTAVPLRLDPLEVVAERLPVPRQALLQRRERDALDPGHQPGEVVDVLVGGGREREAAVAAEHGGDAVHRRRARGRVPQQLRVVVRVQVDEAGRDHEIGRVDRARRALVDVADLDDAAVADADVGALRRRRRCRRRRFHRLIFRSSISAPLESR